MWDVVEGEAGGQTHCCYPPEGEPSVVWSHPVDVHYAAKSLVGWPKMWFQVWHMDDHGLKDLCGYGFCHVPTGPGMHEVEVCTWCPEGTPLEKLQAFFVGGKPRLKYEEVIHSPGDRFRLATRAAGGIKLGPQGGHGHVRFASVEEARRALVSLNHSYMGNRYIELFWAS